MAAPKRMQSRRTPQPFLRDTGSSSFAISTSHAFPLARAPLSMRIKHAVRKIDTPNLKSIYTKLCKNQCNQQSVVNQLIKKAAVCFQVSDMPQDPSVT